MVFIVIMSKICFSWISSILYCHTNCIMVTDEHLLNFFLFLIMSVLFSAFKIKLGLLWIKYGNIFSLINLKIIFFYFPFNLFKIRANVFHIILYLVSYKPQSSLKMVKVFLRFKSKPNTIMHYFGVSNTFSKKIVKKTYFLKNFGTEVS